MKVKLVGNGIDVEDANKPPSLAGLNTNYLAHLVSWEFSCPANGEFHDGPA